MGMFQTCKSLPEPLPDFGPILQNWCKTVLRWCERRAWDDVPWWYGERSSLGLFSLAAWEAGAAPLEEYSTKKGKGRGRWTGRGDLLISIAKKDYIIEAKQEWISISNRATKRENKLDDVIYTALQGARDASEFKGRRAGLVFAVPFLSENEKDSMDKQLLEWVKDLKNRKDCAVAWVFPDEARREFVFDGYLYPGIAVLIRPLRRPC